MGVICAVSRSVQTILLSWPCYSSPYWMVAVHGHVGLCAFKVTELLPAGFLQCLQCKWFSCLSCYPAHKPEFWKTLLDMSSQHISHLLVYSLKWPQLLEQVHLEIKNLECHLSHHVAGATSADFPGILAGSWDSNWSSHKGWWHHRVWT